MDIKTLSNPPIVEALLEIRFNPNKKIEVQALENFADSILQKYPKRESLEDQSFKFVYKKGEDAHHDFQVQPSGFKSTNAEGNRVVIGAIDKFIVSSLAPYSPWPDLKKTAEDLYKEYLEFAPQTEVTRLGMRYINRINIPYKEGFIFQKFINTFPSLPRHEELPKSTSGFETVVVMRHEDIDCISTIRQVLLEMEGNVESGSAFIPFVLDIDVFQEKSYVDVNAEEVWEVFDKMRIKKNAIFFGSLTDEALTPYE